jgi:DNA-binding XRE family transcriptional regulator
MEDYTEQSQMSSELTERQALGERLRQARDYIGLSQEEVARLLQVPRTAVTGMESGQRRVEAAHKLPFRRNRNRKGFAGRRCAHGKDCL